MNSELSLVTDKVWSVRIGSTVVSIPLYTVGAPYTGLNDQPFIIALYYSIKCFKAHLLLNNLIPEYSVIITFNYIHI